MPADRTTEPKRAPARRSQAEREAAAAAPQPPAVARAWRAVVRNGLI